MDVRRRNIKFRAGLNHEMGVLEEFVLYLSGLGEIKTLFELGNPIATPGDQHKFVEIATRVSDPGERVLDAPIHELFLEVFEAIAGGLQLELIAWLIEEYPVVGGGALNKGLVSWLEVRICERDGHAGLRWEETDGKEIGRAHV